MPIRTTSLGLALQMLLAINSPMAYGLKIQKYKQELAPLPIPEVFQAEFHNTLDRVADEDALQAQWAPVDMNDCDPKFSFNVDSPARGFNSNRIAIMFWKGAFRGDRFFAGNGVGDCSKYAEDAQYAISRSHVKHLIEPLEKAGYVVDILLHEMSNCKSKNTEAQLVQRQKTIHGIYGDRVVKNVSHDLTANQFETSALGAQFALDFLRKSNVAYRSLLIWRFDVLSVSQLNVNVYNEGMESDPLIRTLPLNKYNSSDFADWSRQGLTSSIEDLILSMGGWVAPCVLYKLSQGRYSGESAPTSKNEAPGTKPHPPGGSWRYSVYANDRHVNQGGLTESGRGSFRSTSIAVYRGPFVHLFYSNGAMKMCKMLNSLFEGPTCNLNDMALLVCESECNPKAGSAGKAATCFKKFWKRLDDLRTGELKSIAPFPDRQGNAIEGKDFDPDMDLLAEDATAPHREDC